MKIGIIYAMQKEIQTYYDFNKFQKIKYDIYGIDIYISHSKKIILIKSGIGKVSSSIACTILITLYKVDIVINIGSGGSLKPYINIHDIILIKKTSYHDVNLTNFHYSIGQIPNFPQTFQTNNLLRKKFKNILYENKIKFWEGQVVSGDIFIQTKKDVEIILKNFPNAISVDMESASISQVCFQYNKPVIIIKIISDYITKNTTTIFQKNIKKIFYKSSHIIKKYIQTIMM
ncbi:5'-methylthioadenosine/adenosylhomocysteine nucleosidase [Buchnera aphidicola]|uniref:adenosylhomocysteine nucleosidase n=1 Tax=Buchnera aphidicola (Sarucallis kahawaluokalani) TaxID=1241878 RepID=A0A4D6YJQ9_9GAMM|nr:5'-methylthioadenosine/adenosylhomocysteine nucleosidase [Buchnera aphidicola]QCI25948.1 5'-methylthioadenosine/adenosylhomocysteine nucleosidase [Buchnera aphidicola (Sarucallis kahawaluokalani)]